MYRAAIDGVHSLQVGIPFTGVCYTTGFAGSEDIKGYGRTVEGRDERYSVALLYSDDNSLTESVVVKDAFSVIGGPVSEA